MKISGLYAIADMGALAARGVRLREVAEGLRAAGVGLVQLRDKLRSPQEVLLAAAALREAFHGTKCLLVMNDRVDLALLAGFDGVHVGQGDLPPEDVRAVVRGRDVSRNGEGARETGSSMIPQSRFLVGISTHTEEEVRTAARGCADYVAIGPVFATGTKADAEPVVGLEGVRRARALTTKPLVAIGGITRANTRSVVEAGADSVAVISGLFVDGESVEKVARDFLDFFR